MRAQPQNYKSEPYQLCLSQDYKFEPCQLCLPYEFDWRVSEIAFAPSQMLVCMHVSTLTAVRWYEKPILEAKSSGCW